MLETKNTINVFVSKKVINVFGTKDTMKKNLPK